MKHGGAAPKSRMSALRTFRPFDIVAAVALGCFFSWSFFASAFSASASEGAGFGVGDAVKFACGAVVFCLLTLLAFRAFDSERFREAGSRAADKLFAMTPAGVAKVAGIIVLCWLPAIVLMYPFHIGPDTIAQLLWYEGYPVFDPSSRATLPDAAMSDHHPVFDTLLYGVFYDAGSMLGNPVWGMVALCWLQTAFMAIVFAYGCCWMRRRGVPAVLCFVALAFWALNPMFPMLLQQVVKDITSMPLFVLWTFGFLDVLFMVRAGERISAKRTAFMLVLTLLCSLTRKTLLYITVPSLLVVIVVALVKARSASKRRWPSGSFVSSAVRVGFMAAASVLVMMVILPKVVFPAFSVASGGVQETLAVPIQQVSCVVALKGDELSNADKEAIAAVLPYDELETLYTPGSADPVKDSWNRDADSGDLAGFLLVWAKLGLQYPGLYVSAPAYLANYWQVGAYANDVTVVWWGWEDRGGAELFPDYPGGERTWGQSVLHVVVNEILWGSNRVTELLFDEAVYATWIPLFALAALLRRRPVRDVVAFTPVALSWAVLLMVPAFQPRYAFNLVFLCPLIFSMVFVVAGRKSRACDVLDADGQAALR